MIIHSDQNGLFPPKLTGVADGIVVTPADFGRGAGAAIGAAGVTMAGATWAGAYVGAEITAPLLQFSQGAAE